MDWLKNAFIIGSKEYFITWIVVGILSIIAGIVVPSGFIHYLFVFVFYSCFLAVAYPNVKGIIKQLIVLITGNSK